MCTRANDLRYSYGGKRIRWGDGGDGGDGGDERGAKGGEKGLLGVTAGAPVRGARPSTIYYRILNRPRVHIYLWTDKLHFR